MKKLIQYSLTYLFLVANSYSCKPDVCKIGRHCIILNDYMTVSSNNLNFKINDKKGYAAYRSLRFKKIPHDKIDVIGSYAGEPVECTQVAAKPTHEQWRLKVDLELLTINFNELERAKKDGDEKKNIRIKKHINNHNSNVTQINSTKLVIIRDIDTLEFNQSKILGKVRKVEESLIGSLDSSKILSLRKEMLNIKNIMITKVKPKTKKIKKETNNIKLMEVK